MFDIYVNSRGNAARDAKLDQLLAQMEQLMAKVDQLTNVVAQINDATNIVAARVDAELATIQALQSKLSSGEGVDPAELDPVLENLVGVRNRLQGIAADSTNPVPASPDTTTGTAVEPAGSTQTQAPPNAAPSAVGSSPAPQTEAAGAGAHDGAVD